MKSVSRECGPAPISLMATMVLAGLLLVILGCAGEQTNPLPVERIGSPSATEESMAMDIDARGNVNGVFVPGGAERWGYDRYPVSFVGTWTVVNSNLRKSWYIADSDSIGSRVDIVGTMTRLVIDFLDYRQYASAGQVSFWLDGTRIADYSLGRPLPDGQGVSDFIVSTGKVSIATVTMKIESGRAVITGFRMIFPRLVGP